MVAFDWDNSGRYFVKCTALTVKHVSTNFNHDEGQTVGNPFEFRMHAVKFIFDTKYDFINIINSINDTLPLETSFDSIY